MPKSLRHHAHHLDKRLRFRIRIYIVISLVLIGILVYNVARGALDLAWGIAGLSAGIGIGILTARMFHVSWNHDAKKVVSRLDKFGIAILVFYICFEIFRERIVGFVTHDYEVGTIGLAVLAGIMFGRVLGTGGQIAKVLKEQKVFG